MKWKISKIALILFISVILSASLLCPATAADNVYSVRISCIIPAIPGQNMPILQEPRITNTKEQINSPAIFQKDTQEMRITAEGKQLLEIETLYSR